jgi:hypothetical protein
MKAKWLWIAPAAVLGIALFTFIFGEIVRLLWNGLLPPLFGWPTITFWQALGLLVLCRILFGGFGRHGRSGPSPGPAFRRRFADRMADRVAERLERMTPEERERFRQRLRERCGFDAAPSEP